MTPVITDEYFPTEGHLYPNNGINTVENEHVMAFPDDGEDSPFKQTISYVDDSIDQQTFAF